MKKTFKPLLIFCLLALAICLPAMVLAQPAPSGGGAATLNISGKLSSVGEKAGYGNVPIAQTIGRVINVFLSILGVLFLSYTVYAGYLYLISSGNEEKIDKAKSILRGSIIGLIIVFAAYAITRFVIYGVGQATEYNLGQNEGQAQTPPTP